MNGKTAESHTGHRGGNSQPPEQELKCMEQVQTRREKRGQGSKHSSSSKPRQSLLCPRQKSGCGFLRHDVREEGSYSPEWRKERKRRDSFSQPCPWLVVMWNSPIKPCLYFSADSERKALVSPILGPLRIWGQLALWSLSIICHSFQIVVSLRTK